MNQHLDHLARRVVDDPFFLAAPLSRYASAEGLNDDALAARLRCPVHTLTHLRLCRNPVPDAPRFWQDIQQIAARFTLDANALAEIIRYGQSLLRLQSQEANSPKQQSGFLMAARDNDDHPEPPPETLS
jgi:hypothetical protein